MCKYVAGILLFLHYHVLLPIQLCTVYEDGNKCNWVVTNGIMMTFVDVVTH